MMNSKKTIILGVAATAAIVSGLSAFNELNTSFSILSVGPDNNSAQNPFIQPQDPALSGGGRDQSQQFGDILSGSMNRDVMIGRLGTDIFFASGGPDVILGGTEHFNSFNRDRAFGGSGGDTFLWSPGDGSDFFHGGPGYDALMLGLIGEIENGQLVFRVSNDQQAGDVFVDPTSNLPLMDVTNSPGFCEIVDDSFSPGAAYELDQLDLDHLVRFFIRSVADDFEAGYQNTDNGLRVTIHLKEVEFVICASRDGGEIVAYDLRYSPPRLINPHSVPVPSVRQMLR